MNARCATLIPMCLGALAAASPAAGDTTAATGLRVRMTGDVGWSVRAAVRGAARRLENDRCQRVLSEFRDREGRPLAEKLAERGLSAGAFLTQLVFYDGSAHARCASGSTFALTVPGSPVVFVCGTVFAAAYRRHRGLGEATLIHEALHSLGLGENPPASWEITSRVLQRCR